MLQTNQLLHQRYQLKQRLEQNLGRQTWLAKDVAVKPHQLVIIKLLAFNPQMQWEELKLFEREAQVLKHLNHPKIPRYRDYFCLEDLDDSGLPWFALVQDYIAGNSLGFLLENGHVFTEEETIKIAHQVLKILMYLHELSPPVLHRDIKPSNLILGEDGDVYLVDFGSVQDRGKAEGLTFTVVGTSGYAAPEQLWGKTVPASDLYGLGATLIHLLTGTPPAELPQDQMQIQFRELVQISPDFISWIEHLTEPAAENRFDSARKALKALNIDITQVKIPQRNINFIGYGKLLLLSLFTGITGIGIPLMMAFIIPSFLTSGVKRSEAKQYIGSMNRAQQAYFLERTFFASSISDLRLGIKTETKDYSYTTVVTKNAAFNYGISHNSNLKSYIGGVFVLPIIDGVKRDLTTQAILCETESPNSQFLPKPIYKNGAIACATGTIEVTR